MNENLEIAKEIIKSDVFIFDNVELPCPMSDGHRMIPVRTVCKIIDIQFKVQDNWLKSHSFFSQLYRINGTTGADGKTYQMNCLSVFDLYSWLSSISDKQRRDGSLDKQYTFMAFIRERMIAEYKSIDVYRAENERELELQDLREQKENAKSQLKSDLKNLEGEIKTIDESIEAIRVSRFTGQTALQFPN